MSLEKIVQAQNPIPFFILQPFAMVIYLIAALAEINRSPFDMPEAEQELTAGYHTEYSGIKYALFMMTEYIKMIVVSVIAATLFFGGYLGPGVESFPWLGPIYLFIKTFILLFGIIWVRATSPRIRYDRLMSLGWKVMLPIALFNVFLTGILIIVFPGLAA
jgi:NADH-quinone oxidoreductase subunit H